MDWVMLNRYFSYLKSRSDIDIRRITTIMYFMVWFSEERKIFIS